MTISCVGPPVVSAAGVVVPLVRVIVFTVGGVVATHALRSGGGPWPGPIGSPHMGRRLLIEVGVPILSVVGAGVAIWRFRRRRRRRRPLQL